VEACVEGGGRVAATTFPESPWTGGFVIDSCAVLVDPVTAVAGLFSVLREAGCEIEVFSGSDHFRGILFRSRHPVGKRLKESTGLFTESL